MVIEQTSNAEDAKRGNENAIRHIAYAEGYADGKAAERERIIAALLVMHEANKMHHNYYGCLAKLMQDGRL